MQEITREKAKPTDDVDRYITDWHNPFGSQQHRSMNFIDMLIEYREEIVVNRVRREYQERQEYLANKELGLESDSKVMKMSKEEIDDEYENLDLTKF